MIRLKKVFGFILPPPFGEERFLVNLERFFTSAEECSNDTDKTTGDKWYDNTDEKNRALMSHKINYECADETDQGK